MKRKAEPDDTVDAKGNARSKRLSCVNPPNFRIRLSDSPIRNGHQKKYENSEPFKFGVIPELIDPLLLRSVRTEIQKSLSFTPKETDIYKIHQSGDLANLDGLEDSSLSLLPSLLTLRDALYSQTFREYLSIITGAGPLSGRKTDMAINIYTPGCHLLCHDDVIGTRRVSYILYLTDPDRLWLEEWGGALRLYPTQTYISEKGEETKVPSPDPTVSIVPAFNQLSFFAVQPGESFHDVEEVYFRERADTEDDNGRRVRIAISGWYHIPQEGEEGYEEGLEQRLAEKSSLMQLQSKGDAYDLPQAQIHCYEESLLSRRSNHRDNGPSTSFKEDAEFLTEADLDFLLKYIAPNYLTPDTVEALSSLFNEQYSLRLDTFLSKKFASSLHEYITAQEALGLPTTTTEIEASTQWAVARPPHKHRFLYQQPPVTSIPVKQMLSPLQDLLTDLLPSSAFRKWLQLATGLAFSSRNLLARRFRRGKDYTLATSYNEENPRAEITLGITPSNGWGDDENGEEIAQSKERTNLKGKEIMGTQDEDGVGGYEVYMAGDDVSDDDADSQVGSNDGVEVPLGMTTSARASGPSLLKSEKKSNKVDPAVYQTAIEDGGNEDDGVMFCMPAGWNRLSIVLRDSGVLRFVKYVSATAPGDRWDILGEFGVIDHNEEMESDEETQDVQVHNGGANGDLKDQNTEDEEEVTTDTVDDGSSDDT